MNKQTHQQGQSGEQHGQPGQKGPQSESDKKQDPSRKQA